MMSAKAEQPAGSIVVEGYSPRFLAAFNHLMPIEGGFVDDPVDRGGATKYGISLRFLKAEGAFDEDGDGLAEFDLDMDGDIDGQDVRRLTLADARVLYRKFFWDRLRAETWPRPLGEVLFDQAVNAGLTAAGKLLQRAVNHLLMEKARSNGPVTLLKVDGVLGDATREAVQWILRYPGLGMPALLQAYRDATAERYRQIVRRFPAQKRFLNGWLARAGQLGRWAA